MGLGKGRGNRAVPLLQETRNMCQLPFCRKCPPLPGLKIAHHYCTHVKKGGIQCHCLDYLLINYKNTVGLTLFLRRRLRVGAGSGAAAGAAGTYAFAAAAAPAASAAGVVSTGETLSTMT